MLKTERDPRILILLDEFIVIALTLIVLVFFIYPFYVDEILNGIHFWYRPEEALLIEDLFGSYSYVLHDLLLVILFVAIAMLSIVGLRFYINWTINIDNNEHVDYKVIFKIVLIGIVAVAFINLVQLLLDYRFSSFFMFAVFGLLCGTLLTVHFYLMKKIDLERTMSFNEITLKRAFYLGLGASLLFIAMGIYVSLTGDVALAQTKIPNIVAGINILEGILAFVFAILICHKRVYSGGILLILSSYSTISVGGGFIIGIALGILSGILAIISTRSLRNR